MIWNKNFDAPKYIVCIYTQKSTQSEKYIWIIQNVHEKSQFFMIASHDNRVL